MLGDSIDITIELFKEGFFPREGSFYGKVPDPWLVRLHGMLTLDKEVKELTEIVLINSINFDFDKYDIRPDAKIELIKRLPIVEVVFYVSFKNRITVLLKIVGDSTFTTCPQFEIMNNSAVV